MFRQFLTPVLQKLLIANIVIFFLLPVPYVVLSSGYQMIDPNSLFYELTLKLNGLMDFKIYQLLSYQFLHGGFGHLFGNMLLLFFLGGELENRWGSRNFIIFYLSAGALAGLIQSFISTPNTTILGASGAVMAVFAAFTLYNPNRLIYLYFFVPVRIKYLFIAYVAMDLFGALPRAGVESSGVAHFAHLAGAAFGFIYVKYLAPVSTTYYQRWDGPRHQSHSQSPDMLQKLRNMFNTFGGQRTDRPFQSTHTSSSGSVDREKLQFYRQEVDELLDKINAVGYLKLSDDERRRLEQASEYLKKYDTNR